MEIGGEVSSDKTAAGNRFKVYESAFRRIMPRRTYSVCRVDIRAAHSYLRSATRPYDFEFMEHMDRVAETLGKEITGTCFTYQQSDEISIVFSDFKNINTQPWLGGVEAKQVSISAALATATLNRLRPNDGVVMFDSRVFTLSDPVEVANYAIWRQRDAVRNSIMMAAQAHFSHKELQGVNTNQAQELLFQHHGINWNDYPNGFKRGRVSYRCMNDQSRSFWDTEPAPHFVAEPDSWLAEMIPALPTLEK